jgi:uncharacterized membrane protein
MAAVKSTSLIDVSIRKGWNTFTKYPVHVVGAFVLGILLNYTQNILSAVLNNPEGFLALIIGIIGFVVSLLASLGMMAISLDFADGKKLDLNHYVKHTDKLVTFFFASMLTCVLVLAGLIALILPAIYIGIRLQFFTFFILDKNLGAVDSLKASWKLTEGRFFDLLGLWFVSLILNIVGLIAFIVGVFVSASVTSIATASAYRILSGKKLKA